MAWRSKRKVMHAYNVTADIYDTRYGEEQQRIYRKALESIDVLDAVVLDVGCGSGIFFSRVVTKAQTVVGVDISRGLLKKAKQHLTENSHLVQADADYLPFREGAFNAICAFTMIQNMPKPIRTLKEIKRAAAKDGKVIVTGLKKAFPNTTFQDIIDSSGMQTVMFCDDEGVNCYIAVLSPQQLDIGYFTRVCPNTHRSPIKSADNCLV